MSDDPDVIKKHACPACGAEEVMRFHHREGSMEASCGRCGAAVRWQGEESERGNCLGGASEERSDWSRPARREELLAESEAWHLG